MFNYKKFCVNEKTVNLPQFFQSIDNQTESDKNGDYPAKNGLTHPVEQPL